MNFVDTHCHPHFKDFSDKEQLLLDANQAGVSRLIAVGTTLDDSKKAIGFAASHPNVWAAAGVHPHDAKSFQGPALERFLSLLEVPKVVAVGEIGLDYYKDYSPRDQQKTILRQQIEAALPSNLPFIFHIREAFEDFFKIFDSYSNLKGVVHSFSAHPAELEQILSRGLYVGLNGIMTFTSDDQQLEAAKMVPADRLLLETDAPFLAPKPYRGKTCQPKHIRDIAKFLAQLRGQEIEELAKQTTSNAEQLFGLT